MRALQIARVQCPAIVHLIIKVWYPIVELLPCLKAGLVLLCSTCLAQFWHHKMAKQVVEAQHSFSPMPFV